MTKIQWTNYTRIRNKLLNSGGIIFGGAVRDEILHNKCASKYYKEQQEYYKQHPDIRNNTAEAYNYDGVLPHTKDRLLIPTDIDVILDVKSYDDLIKHFTRYYKTQIKQINDLSYFKEEIQKGFYKLHKIELTTEIYGKYCVVKVDLITYNSAECDYLDIQLNYDFDVNSLFWSTINGIHTKRNSKLPQACINNLAIMQDIYTNISNKVAIMNDEFLWSNVNSAELQKYMNIKVYRINKLKQKGWTIKINFNIYKFYKSDTLTPDDKCIICLKDNTETKVCVNFNNCVCNVYICLDCIKKEYTKITTCPTCRKSILAASTCNNYARNELIMYEKFIMNQ
jgi:hypothetical protein